MSKIQLFLLFALITFSLSLHKKNLKNKNKKGFFCKRKLGEGCNWLHCCGDKDTTCDDYVCVFKNVSKTNAQVKWAPEGPKCNWLHGCKNKTLKCENWRCVPKEQKPEEQGVITTAVNAVKNFFTGNSTNTTKTNATKTNATKTA
jgi:hypothetical protein